MLKNIRASRKRWCSPTSTILRSAGVSESSNVRNNASRCLRSTGLITEGEGFEPSVRRKTHNGFRDRTETAAMPHHNWSLHPGGIQGE